MTFLAPAFLYVGAGVALGALALHFIVTRQPLSSPLPTVRFMPPTAVRVTTVAAPEDLRLLALRVLLALVIGAAFARPVLLPTHRQMARVVIADVSRGVGDIAVVRDSARALLTPGDLLVIFDSTAGVVHHRAEDSVGRLERSERGGRLSSALIAGFRAATELRGAADSIDVTIISPLRASEFDGATQAIRALWPGRIRLVHIGGPADSLAPPAGFAVRASGDDPVALAATIGGMPHNDSVARVVRDGGTAADSLWAAAGQRSLVRWPVYEAPPGWIARQPPDTVGAVSAGESPLVFPLERRWRLDPTAPAGRVVARWVDGEPAAVERRVGQGCIRDVAVGAPTRGDVMLRPTFARFLATLAAPCQPAGGGLGIGAVDLKALTGSGPLAATRLIPAPDTVATPLVPWLLVAALALALLELLVRRGSAPLWTDDVVAEPSTSAEAA